MGDGHLVAIVHGKLGLPSMTSSLTEGHVGHRRPHRLGGAVDRHEQGPFQQHQAQSSRPPAQTVL
jgi:hypothetical protein